VLAKTIVLVLLAGIGLISCSGDSDGDGASSADVATSIPLGSAPAAVARLCAAVARTRQQVLCPTRFPLRRGSRAIDARSLVRDDYAGYFLEWHVTRFRGEDLGHVVAAGQPRPFGPLGEHVRTDGEMRLPGRKTLLRRTRVGPVPAVVLKTEPYPAGGVNGGHVVVLWNAGRRGYLVSVHFQGYPLHDRIAAAVSMARSSASARRAAETRPKQPGRRRM
jgi:hypothetical protein